ncbi:MAG: hypothetical protein ABSH47_24560 [Bryobacteraceae bacterium]|jgi:hypothetical protein
MLTLQGEVQPERIAWNRTPEAFAGRRVLVRLAKGTRIEGHWASVTPETFTMNVVKTSDRHVVGKGLQTLPRSSIVGLRTGKQRVRGRVIGVVAGYYSVAAIGRAIEGKYAGEGVWGIVAVAGAIAGFFVGRAVDRATHEITLLP